jgi:hypothetical protein
MSTAATSPSGPVISLENLLFDYPEADVILRSRDSYEFRVLKLYIVNISPILGEKLLLSPNPHPETTASVKSNVERTAANALSAVQLPIDGAILLSLLTYIFPVQPILPSTIEHVMELLSVAQMYKIDVVLTHIRMHIAQQEPPFIREETAFQIYFLSLKYGLRTEALQAARCTLSFSSLNIEDLSKEKKLDLMPGAFLHELWKYHQRARSNLTSDLEEFRNSNVLTILGDLDCNSLANSGLPVWLDSYISDIGTAHVPALLDLTDFHMRLAEHIGSRRRKGGCDSCSYLSRENIRTFWVALTAVVHGGITKVRSNYLSGSSKGPEHIYRLSQILHSLLRERGLKIRPDQLPETLLLHRNTQTCTMQMLSSSPLTLFSSASIDRCWSRRPPFLPTCSLSPNHKTTQRPTSFRWYIYLRMRRF